MGLKASLVRSGSRVDVTDELGATSEMFQRFDGVVLSGSYAMLSEAKTRRQFSGELEAVRGARIPTLGVCFGHQLLGLAFGSRVVRSKRPARGYSTAQVLEGDTIFRGLPPRIVVYESHYEVVDSLPKGFLHLARSTTSEICAMKHPKLPIFGVQFHPERNSQERPDGKAIIANFVRNVESG